MKIRPFSWGWIGKNGNEQKGSITFFQHLQDDNNFVGSYNCSNGGATTTTNRIYGFMNFLLPFNISESSNKGISVHLSLSKESFTILNYTFNNNKGGNFSLGSSNLYINSNDLKKADCFDLYYSNLKNYISDYFTFSSLDIPLKIPRSNFNEASSPLKTLNNIAVSGYNSLDEKGDLVYHNVLSLVVYDHDGYPIGLTPSECYLEAEDLTSAPPYLAAPPDGTTFPISGNSPQIKILKDDNVEKINIYLDDKTAVVSNLKNKYQCTTNLNYSGLTKAFLKVENDGDSNNYTSWLYSLRAKPTLEVELNKTEVNFGEKITATLTYSDNVKNIYINRTEYSAKNSIIFTPNNGNNTFYAEDEYGERSDTIIISIKVITKQSPSLSIKPTSAYAKPGGSITVNLTLSSGDYTGSFNYWSTTNTWTGGTSDVINIPKDFPESKTYHYIAYYNNKNNNVSQSITIYPLAKPEILEAVIEPLEVYGTLDDIEKVVKLRYEVTSSGSSPIYYTFICNYGKDKENLINTKILSETTESAGTLDLSSIPYGNFISITTKIKDKNYGYEETTPKEDGTIYFIPEGPSKPKIIAGNTIVDGLPSNIPGTELEDENTINITTGNYTFYIKVTPEDILSTQLPIKNIKIDFNNDVDDLVDLGIDDTKELELQPGTDTQFYTIYVTDSAGRVNNEGFVEIYRIGPPSVVPRDIPITISDETGTDSGIDQLNYYTQLKPSTDNGVLVFNLDESENLIVNIGYTWKVNYSYNEINYPLVINKTDEDYGTIGKGVNYKTSLKDFYELIESEFGIREEKLSGEIRATIVDAFGQEATGYYSQSLNIIYAIPPKFPDKIIYIGVDPFPGQTLGERKLFFNEIFYKSSDVVPKADDAAYLSWITKTLLNPGQKVILGIPRAEYENEASLKEYKISYALESTADNALTRRYIYKIENSFTPEKIIQNFENFEIENENLTDYDFITFDLPGNFDKSNFYYFKIDAVSTQDAQTGVGDYPSLYSIHPVLQSRNVSPEIKLTNFSSDIVENDKRKYLIVNSNFNFVDIGGNNIGGSGVDSYNYYPNFDKEYVNYNFTPDLTMTIEGSTAPFSSDAANIILNKTFNFTLDSYYKMINSFSIKEEIDFNAGVELTFEKLYLRFVLTMNTGMDPKTVGEKISVQSLPAVKIHYELMPTLAYRENHLGINTKTFEDTDLFNINANQRNDAQRKYVRFRGDIGEETSEIRFDLSLGQIVQVIIDGGTWD